MAVHHTVYPLQVLGTDLADYRRWLREAGGVTVQYGNARGANEGVNGGEQMLLLIILLVLLLGGGGGYYGYSQWGAGGGMGVLGTVLLVVLIVYLLGGLHFIH